MSVLKNPRHERFAQLLTHGITADEAHTKAGYRPDRRNVTRLTTNDDIRERVAELQAAAAGQAVITLESHLKVLASLRDKACAEGRYSAAIRAEIARGRAAGLYVERIEAQFRGSAPGQGGRHGRMGEAVRAEAVADETLNPSST